MFCQKKIKVIKGQVNEVIKTQVKKTNFLGAQALIPFECQQLLWFISFWER
jgi:hypothetical protein